MTVAAASVSGFSAAMGYLLAVKQLEKQYAEIATAEIDEAKRFYGTLYKKEETPEQAVERLLTSSYDKEAAVEALRTYQGRNESTEAEATEPDIAEEQSEPMVNNIFVDNKPLVEGEWDQEVEQSMRTVGEPYVISHEEFLEAESGYEQTTVTYYEDDETLADERDKVIEDVERTVGEDNLQKFGHGSNDSNVVYVRNDRIELDFEVIRSYKSFAEEVLGFIEHSDYRPKIRKFRGDDE